MKKQILILSLLACVSVRQSIAASADSLRTKTKANSVYHLENDDADVSGSDSDYATGSDDRGALSQDEFERTFSPDKLHEYLSSESEDSDSEDEWTEGEEFSHLTQEELDAIDEEVSRASAARDALVLEEQAYRQSQASQARSWSDWYNTASGYVAPYVAPAYNSATNYVAPAYNSATDWASRWNPFGARPTLDPVRFTPGSDDSEEGTVSAIRYGEPIEEGWELVG